MGKVGIIMGSKSDLSVMQEAIDILKDFGISYEADIVSAHRTPEKMMEYAKNAHEREISVIIAGAGAKKSYKKLRRFIQKYKIPTTTTLHGLGVID